MKAVTFVTFAQPLHPPVAVSSMPLRLHSLLSFGVIAAQTSEDTCGAGTSPASGCPAKNDSVLRRCEGILQVNASEPGAEALLEGLLRRRGSNSEPVLVTGLEKLVGQAGSSWTRSWHEGAMSWTHDILAQRYGDERVPIRDVDGSIFAQFSNRDIPRPGQPPKDASLRASEKLYLKEFLLQNLWRNSTIGQVFLIGKHVPPSIAPEFPVPDFVTDKPDHFNPVLSFGNARHGAAFHTHGAAWLVTVRGAKRWFLFEPNSTPSIAHKRYLASPHVWGGKVAEAAKSAPHAQPLICDVRRGEGIWVPFGWWHATLNLEETLAAGHQMSLTFLTEESVNELRSAFPASSSFIWQAMRYTKDFLKLEALNEEAVAQEPYNFFFLEYLLTAWVNKATEAYRAGRMRETRQLLADVRLRVDEMLASLEGLHSQGFVSSSEVAFVLQHVAVAVFESPLAIDPYLHALQLLHDAYRLVKAAEKYSPQDLKLLDRLADMTCQIQDARQCKAVLQKILDLDPENKHALDALEHIKRAPA